MFPTRSTTGGHPPRITHAYGSSLRWTKLDKGLVLTVESATALREEGFTMVTTKTGWGKTRRVSLIQYLHRHHHPE